MLNVRCLFPPRGIHTFPQVFVKPFRSRSYLTGVTEVKLVRYQCIIKLANSAVNCSKLEFTHCRLATLYGDINLGQHSRRQWLFA